MSIIQEHIDKKEPYIHIYIKDGKTYEIEYQGTSEDMTEMIGTIITDTIEKYFGDPIMTMALLYQNVMQKSGIELKDGVPDVKPDNKKE